MQWSDWRPRDPSLQPGFDAWRAGNLDAAQSFFSHVIANNLTDELITVAADTWRGLGNVHWSRKDFPAALACYRQTIHLEPWNPMHWANLGLALRDLARGIDAIAAFRVSLQIDPAYAPALNEWANTLFDLGRYTQALALYDQSLSIDSSRAVVHHNKGVCLRHMGDASKARACFHRALALDPTYAHTLCELARLDGLST